MALWFRAKSGTALHYVSCVCLISLPPWTLQTLLRRWELLPSPCLVTLLCQLLSAAVGVSAVSWGLLGWRLLGGSWMPVPSGQRRLRAGVQLTEGAALPPSSECRGRGWVWRGGKPTALRKPARNRTVHAAQIHLSGEVEDNMDDDDMDGAIHVVHAMHPEGCLQKRIPKCNIQNPADYFSRHARPTTVQEDVEAEGVEDYVQLVVDQSQPLPVLMQEFQSAAQAGECIQPAIASVRTRKWHEMNRDLSTRTEDACSTLAAFYHVR
ncbi:hypothetical protein NDU88_004757 [Pleurodeles waltl]|uniref:Uncharacterized protein n=1 Tax=Pleurodeles waltl TaxID=8319 RepID=A0AAV7V3X0_PLEWA|nr:hypothetical protein NDU88_004757 [Pleurodeles waltl]